MKVGLIALTAITALSFGVTVIASAQFTDNEVTAAVEPGQIFARKLAGVLELDEGQVSDAAQQVHQEIREEGQQQRLQNALDEELITVTEAEQIQEWWDSRPEAIQQLGSVEGFGYYMRGGLMRQFRAIRANFKKYIRYNRLLVDRDNPPCNQLKYER